MISFELARQLRRQQQSGPVHVFVSGRRAAHVADLDPPVHNLPEAEFIQELRRLNGTPKEVLEQEELMQIMIPLLRADFAVGETYQYPPESPLSCSMSAFGGLQDEEASRQELEAWGEQTSAGFSLDMFPGDHFFLHSAQSLLLEVLSQQLRTLVQQQFPEGPEPQ